MGGSAGVNPVAHLRLSPNCAQMLLLVGLEVVTLCGTWLAAFKALVHWNSPLTPRPDPPNKPLKFLIVEVNLSFFVCFHFGAILGGAHDLFRDQGSLEGPCGV